MYIECQPSLVVDSFNRDTMKTIQQKSDVEVSGDFSTTDFSVNIHSEVFNHLSSNVYSDSVAAVIREPATNAYDSHVENGNPDEKFYVQLPTHLDQTYRIRDYGTGLSKEDTVKYFGTYFLSSRDQSNEYTGNLGIGSKCFYAVSDSYNVISYFNGKKYTFTAYKENGFPKFAELGESDTDEPNGIEIVTSVSANKIFQFHEKAFHVYKVFQNPPRLNIKEIEDKIDAFKKSCQYGNGYFIDPNGGDYVKIWMSNVAYNTSIAQNTYINGTIYFEFENGSCQFNLGREEIKITDEIRNQIKEKVDILIQESIDKLQQEVNKCKYEQDARILIAKDQVGKHYFSRFLFNRKPITAIRELHISKTCYQTHGRTCKAQTGSYISAGTKFIWGKEKTLDRVRHFVRSHYSQVYLVDEEFVKKYDINPEKVIDPFDLPKPEKKKREPNTTYIVYDPQYMREKPTKEIGEGVYLERNFGKVERDFRDLPYIVAALKADNYKVPLIYLLNKKDRKNIKLPHFGDYLKDLLKNVKVEYFSGVSEYSSIIKVIAPELLNLIKKREKAYYRFCKNSKEISGKDLDKELEKKYPALKIINTYQALRNPELLKKVLGC